MYIENEETFKSCLQDGINLFLGSGFSVEAKGVFENEQKRMPAGDDLRVEILKHFKRDPHSQMSLAQICQIISKTNRDALNDFFRSRFSVTEFDKSYLNLENLNIKSIFTTNIDDLVFKIFNDSQKYYINDISLRGPSIAGASAIDYIALHGSIVHQKTESLDFSPIEIASSFERDKDKWHGYIGRIQQTPTIYWGYSVADAGVLQALSKESSHGREKAPAWVTIRSRNEETIEYYSSLGFQIIIGDTNEILKYFGKLKFQETPNNPKRLVDARFSEYLIPKINNVPVRPISEFYLGAEPAWYDIFLGKLHKTKYFSVIQNAIAGKKNCILTGTAVTGKSTLLKLIANSITNAQVLYIDEITPEKAKILARDINSEAVKTIVFVDNAADAWEAIDILINSNNVQIVAAERDYIFDSVSHRFSKKKFDIIDISGLLPLDVQGIKDNIPNGIQRQHAKPAKSPLHVDFNPTFFEVLDSHIVGHGLAERFMEALKDFRTGSPEKYDLILLSCYLYSCRVPTSVDVAISLLADRSSDAKQVYDFMNSMSNLLSKYEGVLAETEQAYFVPRSRSVAEAVMNRVMPNELRSFLKQFHTNVSPTKIPRYDIFRRMGYDANLTKRAFPDWKDGLKFYEDCFERDNSFSFKQQGAIYLSRKRQYPLAFKWIDEAMSIAGKRGASVKNTYAVIMFNANFDKSANLPAVIATLDESMQILKQCYTDDLRKVYHAKVFSDQAVKYANKFPTSTKSDEYLDTAIKWLNFELQSRPEDRSIIQLLRSLKSAKRNLAR